MTHNGLIFLMLFLAALCFAALMFAMADVSHDGCLIYGIDFNGKNEPFGLFCN